jgi:arsenate reductase (thioredoxin)
MDGFKESCPIFPGQPMIANWNIPNPEEGAVSDDQKLIKFREVGQQIQSRIQLLCSFPMEKLSHLVTQSALAT